MLHVKVARVVKIDDFTFEVRDAEGETVAVRAYKEDADIVARRIDDRYQQERMFKWNHSGE